MSSIDYLHKYRTQLGVYVFFTTIVAVGFTALSYAYISNYTRLDASICLIISAATGGIFSIIGSILSARYASVPLKILQQVVLHAAGGPSTLGPPNLETVHVGKELVSDLAHYIFQFASNLPILDTSTVASNILDQISIPIIGIDSTQTILTANIAAAQYVEKNQNELIGSKLYDCFHLEFTSDNTFENWLTKAHSKITDTSQWERVRLEREGQKPLQCDLAASFSKGNQSGIETTMALFDHTEKYNQIDNDLTFISIAVHELRTPLTIMRGYVEIFEDELGPTLNPEMKAFMQKMNASAEQLTGFVSNILNVARIEENQLSFSLEEQDWTKIVSSAVDDMTLRANVRGKKIEATIAPNIPSVGVDKVSIYEVITNLLDNAIKYSGQSEKILVNVMVNKEGFVETHIQDFGLGIPASVASTLFEKYARNHRNKGQIAGTGLGLYLSKAIVKAHDGNIWLTSTEGEGTTFGFTVVPFAKLKADQKISGSQEITRSAHGWIKNHSMYRR